MRYSFQSNRTIYDVNIERQGDQYRALIDGQIYDLEILDSQPGQIDLIFAGRPLTCYWANEGDRKWISIQGCTHLLERPLPRHFAMGDLPASSQIRSPMPAQVQEIRVAEGELVEKGQIVLLLEAMKMEIRIQAPYVGRIKRLLVEQGQTVNRDQPLAIMDEPGKAGESSLDTITDA